MPSNFCFFRSIRHRSSGLTMLEDDFSTADAGASATYPVQCSALRKNGFVMIRGRPCQIVEMSTSKTGKHGHTKVNLVAMDIFTHERVEVSCPSTDNVDVPNVTREEHQLMYLKNGFLSLMLPSGKIKDLKIPDGDLGREMVKKFHEGEEIMVSVLKAVGEEHAVDFKIITK